LINDKINPINKNIQHWYCWKIA